MKILISQIETISKSNYGKIKSFNNIKKLLFKLGKKNSRQKRRCKAKNRQNRKKYIN